MWNMTVRGPSPCLDCCYFLGEAKSVYCKTQKMELEFPFPDLSWAAPEVLPEPPVALYSEKNCSDH